MSNENFIAEGRHAAVCRSIQFGWTKSDPPKEQIAIGLEIVGEDVDATRTITYFGTFDEAKPGKTRGAVDFTIEALRNLGWTGDDMSELPTLAESGALVEEVSIVVAHEEYNGNWSAKVKWINKPGGGGKIKLEAPLDDRQLKGFAASMKAKLRGSAARPANGTAKPAHPNAPGGRRGDDDLPFASCDLADDPTPIARVLR